MHLGNTPEEIELQRKLLLMRFFAIAGNLVMVPLMVLSLAQQRWEAGIILIVVIVLITAVIIDAHRRQKTDTASALVASGLWLFSLYLGLTGGFDGTGIYFAFSLVVLMIMIAGLRLGAALALGYALVLILGFILEPGFLHAYPDDTRPRIAASMVFILLLTVVAEWIHLQSYAAIRFTAETHRRNSLTDSLTTLVNRAGLERRLGQWTDPRQPAVVALIDIDHFKAINDDHGHDVGDKVLSTFAKVMRNNLKQEDTVCRWGGEEFILLFENTTEQQATSVVDELRELMAGRTFSFDGKELGLTFSAGIAVFEGERGFADALKQADARVYEAKRAGRDRVVGGVSRVTTAT